MSTYLDAIIHFLPPELSNAISRLCQSPDDKLVIDRLIRFVTEAPDSSSSVNDDWAEKQRLAQAALDNVIESTGGKRRRVEESSDQLQVPKRPKLQVADDTEDPPLFTLHSLSVSSPVRKKVDISIHKISIRFLHPTNHTVEAMVPLSALTRAFLVPTRGKQKPHWTVILLSSDVPDRGGASGANPQIIFGIDAVTTSNMSTSIHSYPSEATMETYCKGSETLPILRKFLSHLPIPPLEPSTDVFRSAIGGSGLNGKGIPGVEAHRAAKSGSLWFMKEGVLWGDSKPCEFWSVEDLVGKTEGLRIFGGSGKLCSLILSRKVSSEGDDEDHDSHNLGAVESEFGFVDAREQEPINQWVRQHQHLFGRRSSQPGLVPPTNEKGTTKNNNPPSSFTMNQATLDESDDEDASFTDSESSDDGSGSSSSSSDSEGEAEASENGGSENEVDDGDEDDSMEELQPEHHPLLRPGAVPRMSRAAIDMVVNMVEEDFIGAKDSEGDEEEDELED